MRLFLSMWAVAVWYWSHYPVRSSNERMLLPSREELGLNVASYNVISLLDSSRAIVLFGKWMLFPMASF